MKTPREKWISALRSGKYKQTKWRLQTHEGYCCLGVLCDVAMKEGVIDKENYVPPTKTSEANFDGSVVSLPHKVQEWAGLRTPSGAWGIGKATEHLTYLNDNADKSFSEIADVLENPPEGLFIS